MSSEDLLLIKKEIRSSYLTGIITSLMIATLYLLIRYIRVEELAIKEVFTTSAIVTGIIFISTLATKNLRRDLNNGIKNLYTYKVIDKLSFLDNDPGLGGVKMKYYLLTPEKRFPVDEKAFSIATEGDSIIEHQTPKSLITLRVEIFPH